VQRVEGVEELLLRLLFVLEKLDVVDQEHVDIAVAALKPDAPTVLDGIDELVGELLARGVVDP
jgi:hypothetical protein